MWKSGSEHAHFEFKSLCNLYTEFLDERTVSLTPLLFLFLHVFPSSLWNIAVGSTPESLVLLRLPPFPYVLPCIVLTQTHGLPSSASTSFACENSPNNWRSEFPRMHELCWRLTELTRAHRPRVGIVGFCKINNSFAPVGETKPSCLEYQSVTRTIEGNFSTRGVRKLNGVVCTVGTLSIKRRSVTRLSGRASARKF